MFAFLLALWLLVSDELWKGAYVGVCKRRLVGFEAHGYATGTSRVPYSAASGTATSCGSGRHAHLFHCVCLCVYVCVLRVCAIVSLQYSVLVHVRILLTSMRRGCNHRNAGRDCLNICWLLCELCSIPCRSL